MKRCLADVNVCLALLVRHHEHHQTVRRWYDGIGSAEMGLCRIVQLAAIRLLGNQTIMGKHAVPAGDAWDVIDELMLDERVEFVFEPPGLSEVMPTLLNYPIPTAKLITDAYLASFAISSPCRLVTLDRAFRQFREVDLLMLGR
jgi:toxin-antitoxin system PIN domain toxin